MFIHWYRRRRLALIAYRHHGMKLKRLETILVHMRYMGVMVAQVLVANFNCRQ